MKTRISALAAVIGSSALLAACGGGGGGFTSDPSTSTPTPAPTVSINAPATATASYPYTVSWTSTDATSCSADFSSKETGATGSVEITEPVGTYTYNVTCTGDGGSANSTATVVVGEAATAEGAWNGSTGSGNTLAGVVTKEGDYWLTISDGSGTAVGFYAGHGTSSDTSPTEGTFASSNMREANFTGGFDGGVNTAGGELSSGAYTGMTSLTGTFDPVSGSSSGPAFVSATFSLAQDGKVSSSLASGTVTGSGTATLDDSGAFSMHYQTHTSLLFFGTNPANADLDVTTTFGSDSVLNGDSLAWTTDITHINSCTALDTAGSGICSGAVGIGDQPLGADQNPVVFDLSGIGATTVITSNASDPTNATTYTLTVTGLTLSSVPQIPASETFGPLAYDPSYEDSADVATLEGSYLGTAGVGVASQSATFAISGGAISGTEDSGCSYTGTAAAHTSGGNVYDVTDLLFTGSTCVYDGITFTGVATYDATSQKVTIMALDDARDKSVMLVGAATTP